MYKSKTIYSLNKQDPEAIVYTDAYGRITRLTRADFDTEADFLRWKAWSDEEYHATERQDHVTANHTVPFDPLSDGAISAEAPEIVIEQRLAKSERESYTTETIIRIKGQLTDRQFRRLWLYCVEGLTEEEIARAESVGQRRISESIMSALKKIKKLLLFRQNSES